MKYNYSIGAEPKIVTYKTYWRPWFHSKSVNFDEVKSGFFSFHWLVFEFHITWLRTLRK